MAAAEPQPNADAADVQFQLDQLFQDLLTLPNLLNNYLDGFWQEIQNFGAQAQGGVQADIDDLQNQINQLGSILQNAINEFGMELQLGFQQLANSIMDEIDVLANAINSLPVEEINQKLGGIEDKLDKIATNTSDDGLTESLADKVAQFSIWLHQKLAYRLRYGHGGGGAGWFGGQGGVEQFPKTGGEEE